MGGGNILNGGSSICFPSIEYFPHFHFVEQDQKSGLVRRNLPGWEIPSRTIGLGMNREVAGKSLGKCQRFSCCNDPGGFNNHT